MAKKKDSGQKITVQTPEGLVTVPDPYEYQEPEKVEPIKVEVKLPEEKFFDPYEQPLKPYQENFDNSVRLQDKNGEIVDVLKEDKDFLINRQGYKELSDEQKKEFQLKETYGDAGSTALAGVEGLFKGASFGLINKGLNALGDVIMNPNIMSGAQEARKKANPSAALLGEVAGIGTQFAATGGFGNIGAKSAARLGLNVDAAASNAFENILIRAKSAGVPFKDALKLAEGARAAELAKLSIYGRMGGRAVANGIEGAIYASGDEAVKALFDDPNQTLGSAATNIGLYGLLGGAVAGAAFSGAGELWNSAFGNKVTANLKEINKYIDDFAVRQEENSYLKAFTDDALLPEVEVPPSVESILKEPTEGRKTITQRLLNSDYIIGGKKKNAADIEDAAQRLGIKPTTGMLDADPYVGYEAETLSKTPTPEGKFFREERLDAANKAQDVVDNNLLGDRHPKYVSEYEVGKKSKNIFETVFTKLRDGLSERYKKIEKYFNYIDLDEAQKNKITLNVTNTDAYNNLLQDEKNIVDQVLEQVNGAKNLTQLKSINTTNNQRILNLQDENTVLANVLREVKKEIKLARAEQIKKTSIAIAGKEGKEIADAFVKEVSQLDTDYAAYKRSIEEFVEETGFRKTGKYAGDLNKLLDKFNSLSNENFSKKLLNVNDRDLLLYLKQNFPEVFEQIRKLNLKNIHKAITSNAEGSNMRLSISSFLDKMDDLGPVTQELFFPGKSQTIDDLRLLYTSNPGVFNVSSTAPAQSIIKKYGKALLEDKTGLTLVSTILSDLKGYGKVLLLKNEHNIKQAVKSVGNDKAAEAGLLKTLTKTGREVNASGFKVMVDYYRQALKGAETTSKAIINLIQEHPSIIPQSLKPDEKAKEKLDKRVKEFGDNPSAMLDIYKDFNHYIDDHGMAIAAASANAVNYLNTIRPVERKEGPLDDPMPPTLVEKQNYDVALSIAQQPLMILEDIKDGTLNSQKLLHLQNLYPDFYANMRFKVMNQLVEQAQKGEKIPYKTRMGLSLFLGTPLDSTMKPEGIMALQPKMAQAQQQEMMPMQQQAGNNRQRGSMKNIGKLADQQLTPMQTRIMEKQSVKV